MDKACQHPNCANEGMFEGECPGNSDEMSHCEECNRLWWVDKGNGCDSCDKFRCSDCMDDYSLNDDDELICADCKK